MNFAALEPAHLVVVVEWLFLAYFIGMNGGYMLLNLLSIRSLRRFMEASALDTLPRTASGFEPPVTIIVPGFNAQSTIAASIRSLLQLDYPEYEVIVVNDGSRDATLATLKREFGLALFPEAYWKRLATRPVHGIYRSARHPNLRVIDKANGSKADALNAGINAARYPLFFALDSGAILQRDSLHRLVQPFLEDPATIAAGGTERIANGCSVTEGFLTRAGLPRNLIALIQIVEYLRAFLYGRLGWASLNAALIISGACAVFRKDDVIAAGGYRTDTVGEGMELVMRLHRINRVAGRHYRIALVPAPLCWTEAPETLKALKSQRIRWQRGLAEALKMNIGLLFHPRGGTPGWLAFPFVALFEWLGPLIEVAAYLAMTTAWLLGLVSLHTFAALILVAVGLGILLSVCALLLDEFAFHLFRKPGQLGLLLLAVLVENLGYRQLLACWRVAGLRPLPRGTAAPGSGMPRASGRPSPPKDSAGD